MFREAGSSCRPACEIREECARPGEVVRPEVPGFNGISAGRLQGSQNGRQVPQFDVDSLQRGVERVPVARPGLVPHAAIDSLVPLEELLRHAQHKAATFRQLSEDLHGLPFRERVRSATVARLLGAARRRARGEKWHRIGVVPHGVSLLDAQCHFLGVENDGMMGKSGAGSAGYDFDNEWWHFRRPGTYEPLDAPLTCFAVISLPIAPAA